MRFIPIISLMATLILLGGCDNVVEPISEGQSESIAIYGLLDMRTERQVVRLEILRSTILAQPGELDGITVRSIAMGSASFQEWSRIDSVDATGNPISVFVSDFTPQAGVTYRLDVFRDGVKVAEARTSVPNRPRLILDPVIGDVSTLSQTLYLLDVNGAPERLNVSYTVVDIDEALPTTVPVPYGLIADGPVTHFSFDVTYWSDRFVVMNQLGRDIDEVGVRLRELELSFDLPSQEWTSAQTPNDRNNLGFFASVGRYTYSWILDEQSVSTIGWINEQ